MLKNRITRIIAGFISCVLVGIFVGNLMIAIVNENKHISDSPPPDYTSEMNDIYYKLWAVGNMWLRNLDENGNFKGTEALKKQTISALQKIGCMNSNGELVLMTKDYNYYVSYGSNNCFKSSNLDFSAISSTKYALSREHDNIYYSLANGCIYTNDNFNMYDTNYGMHYYYLDGNGIALFDYDTTNLKSYIDELGATIYYKEDHSTPSPDDKDTDSWQEGNVHYYKVIDYFSDYENKNEEITEIEPTTFRTEIVSRETYEKPEHETENVSRETYDNGLYFYDTDLNKFIRVEDTKKIEVYQNDVIENDIVEGNISTDIKDGVIFTKTLVQEMALNIAICPNEEIVNKIDNYYVEREVRTKNEIRSVINCIPLLIIAAILAIYVFALGGYDVKSKKFIMISTEKIFAEIYIFFIIAIIVFGVIGIDHNYDIIDIFRELYSVDAVPYFYGIVYGIAFGLVILMLNSIIIRIKCKSLLKTMLIGRIWDAFMNFIRKIRKKFSEKAISREMIKNDIFTRRFIIRTCLLIIGVIFSNMFFYEMREAFLIFVADIIIFGGYVFLQLADLRNINNVSRHIEDISKGDYIKHNEDENSPTYVMTERLNNISSGIQAAVDRQIKSERMKIDLVTNVSHDLKTPLTSIISYIDLLSTEELSPEAMDYVNIIQQKSQHLKDMVADLFDLAKATSRTDISMEKIDAVILVNQVIADLSDKIENSGKQFKVNIMAETAPIMAEGKKMYRVLQNIIDNALKYSLNGTRIYLNLECEKENCIIRVKNIASYEMNFSPDEITERFTRGDESRSTDGNGLGLSIAKNFTEACGGNFNIIIDGDLFTAEISMPVI